MLALEPLETELENLSPNSCFRWEGSAFKVVSFLRAFTLFARDIYFLCYS